MFVSHEQAKIASQSMCEHDFVVCKNKVLWWMKHYSKCRKCGVLRHDTDGELIYG